MGDLKFQLQHYAGELWRRKWSILLIGLLVGILGVFFAATRPDVFTSRAAVEVDENALLNAVLPRGAPRTNTEAAIDTVRRGIYARPNLEQIVYDTDLNLTLADRRGMEALVENLEEKLELKRQGTNFYIIEYTHNNPITARNVTQAALDIFMEKSLEDVSSGDGKDKEQARSFLQNKLSEANRKLAETQAKIAAYQRDNGDAISGSTSVQNQMRGLETQISGLKSDLLLYQGELSNLQSRLSTTPPEVITRYEQQAQPLQNRTPPPLRPTVNVPQGPTPEQDRANDFERQLGELQRELNTMLERLTPQHPDVQTMQSRLSQAQAEFAQLDAAARNANARLDGERARANQIMAQYENDFRNWQIQSTQQAQPLPPRPVYGPNPAVAELRAQADDRRSRINVLERQIDAMNQEIRRVRDVMTRQPEIVQQFSRLTSAESKLLSEIGALENQLDVIQPSIIQAVRMKVVEPPIVPVTPAGPNRLLLFLGAFLLAGGSGIGLAFMRVQMADNLPTIRHLKQNFDLPILGGVSSIETSADNARKAAGNLVYLASVAALIAIFGYITYRYHFELWRPDFGRVFAALGIGSNTPT